MPREATETFPVAIDTQLGLSSMYKLQPITKTAAIGSMLGRVLPAISRWALPRSAPGWAQRATQSGLSGGLFSGALGAGFSEEGERWKGFGKGFATGFGVGGLSSIGGQLASKMKIPGLSSGIPQRAARRNQAVMGNLTSGALSGAGWSGLYEYSQSGDLNKAVGAAGIGALGGGAAHSLGQLGRLKAIRQGKGPTSWLAQKATGIGGQIGAHIGVHSLLTPRTLEEDPNLKNYYAATAIGKTNPMSFLPR